MEDKWVTSSSNSDKKVTKSYTEVFNEQFSYYLSMGMTENEYWWGDNDYPALYKKAYDLKLKQIDEESWLKGAYIYAAICKVSPILHAFAKKGTKPEPYLELPVSFSKDENVVLAKEKREMEMLKADFQAKMKLINDKLKGGKSNG